MGSGKQRWKISFHRKKPPPPIEFICSITGSLMADPVIVSSGHTFERNCVQICKELCFNPILPDGSAPDFSAVIPNLALRSTILKWCDAFLVEHPKSLDLHSAEKLIRALMTSSNHKSQESHNRDEGDTVEMKFPHVDYKLNRPPAHSRSSSDESVTGAGAETPLPLKTRPSCYSSSSSSDIEVPNLPEDDEIFTKLISNQVFQQEEALISLRKLTRAREDTRLRLCTPRLLSALRSLIASKYPSIQVNAIAALVNLSLENQNKVTIVRSGIVPHLINVLRAGFPDAQDHAAGALFSLSLDDQNKTAIGVLGALPPLLHALRSHSERARNDSSLALYHLSLVQSNRSKMVKLGSVQTLLVMAKSGHLTGRVMLILYNLAACVEGRVAMLDEGAVGCVVGMLRVDGFDSDSTQDSCLAVLCGLSYGGLRFKALAKEAGAEEVLRKVEEEGSERVREKARRVMEMMKVRDEEEEDEVDWEELLNSGEVNHTHYQLIHG